MSLTMRRVFFGVMSTVIMVEFLITGGPYQDNGWATYDRIAVVALWVGGLAVGLVLRHRERN